MTPAEARQILLTHRPGVDDAEDPAVGAALALARESPELRRWLEENDAARRALRERFREIPVPEGLRQQILAELPRTVRRPWSQPIARIGLAAAAVVLIAGLFLTIRNPGPGPGDGRDLDTFRGRMIGAVLRDYRMSLETGDAQQIRTHLAQNLAPADYHVPRGLAVTELTGCGVLSWADRRVSMVCFRSGRPMAPGTKADLFLFVVSRDSVPNSPAGHPPEIRRVRTLVTASWSEGDKLYILAADGDEAFLRGLL